MSTNTTLVHINGTSVPFNSLPPKLQELVLVRHRSMMKLQELQRDTIAMQYAVNTLTADIVAQFGNIPAAEPVVAENVVEEISNDTSADAPEETTPA